MIKLKFYNYKVLVEFGNGKSATFKARRLEGIFQNAKALAKENGTTFLSAKIHPLSQMGKNVCFKDGLYLDPLGKYYYFYKGERMALQQ